MNAKELLRRYKAGERNFSGLDLKEVNVSGIDPDLDIGAYDELCPDFAADLTGINLSGADLTKAILAGANLTNANLSNTNLSNAALERCNLTNTNLSGANLTRACLSGAKLECTNMRGANLLNAEIRVSDYFSPDLTGAKNVDTVNFTGRILHLVLEDGTVIDTTDNDW